MPRFLVTERVYVDAVDEIAAVRKVRHRIGHLAMKDSHAECVTPEPKVGMAVRLVSRTYRPRPCVPTGSEGVVTDVSGSVTVVFHARHESCAEGPPWTLQFVHPDNLEVVEGWSS